MILSKILDNVGSKEIGRQFTNNDGSPFLKKSMIFDFLNESGNMPVVII